MLNVAIDDKDIARLERRLAQKRIPPDEAAFIRFLIKKYKASLPKTAKKPAKGGGGWTFTWDGYSWKYKFG